MQTDPQSVSVPARIAGWVEFVGLAGLLALAWVQLGGSGPFDAEGYSRFFWLFFASDLLICHGTAALGGLLEDSNARRGTAILRVVFALHGLAVVASIASGIWWVPLVLLVQTGRAAAGVAFNVTLARRATTFGLIAVLPAALSVAYSAAIGDSQPVLRANGTMWPVLYFGIAALITLPPVQALLDRWKPDTSAAKRAATRWRRRHPRQWVQDHLPATAVQIDHNVDPDDLPEPADFPAVDTVDRTAKPRRARRGKGIPQAPEDGKADDGASRVVPATKLIIRNRESLESPDPRARLFRRGDALVVIDDQRDETTLSGWLIGYPIAVAMISLCIGIGLAIIAGAFTGFADLGWAGPFVLVVGLPFAGVGLLFAALLTGGLCRRAETVLAPGPDACERYEGAGLFAFRTRFTIDDVVGVSKAHFKEREATDSDGEITIIRIWTDHARIHLPGFDVPVSAGGTAGRDWVARLLATVRHQRHRKLPLPDAPSRTPNAIAATGLLVAWVAAVCWALFGSGWFDNPVRAEYPRYERRLTDRQPRTAPTNGTPPTNGSRPRTEPEPDPLQGAELRIAAHDGPVVANAMPWGCSRVASATQHDLSLFPVDRSQPVLAANQRTWHRHFADHRIAALRFDRFEPARTLAVMFDDGHFQLLDAATGDTRASRTFDAPITAVEFASDAADGGWLLLGDQRGGVRTVEVDDLSTRLEFRSSDDDDAPESPRQPQGPIRCVAVSPAYDGIAAGSEGLVRFWLVRDQRILGTAEVGGTPAVVGFFPNQPQLAQIGLLKPTGAVHGVFRITGEIASPFEAALPGVIRLSIPGAELCMGPSGDRVAGIDPGDGSIGVWSAGRPGVDENGDDAEDGARRQRRYVGGHEHPVTSIAFSRDGKRLVTGDESGGVVVWFSARQ